MFIWVWVSSVCVCVCCVWQSGTVLGCISVISGDEWAQRERWGGGWSVTSSQGLIDGGGAPGTHRNPSTHHPLQPPPYTSTQPLSISEWRNESCCTVVDSAWCLAARCRHCHCRPPALTAQGGYRIESVIRYASRPLSMLELNTSPLADCEDSNRLLHAWLRYPWLDPPFGLRR